MVGVVVGVVGVVGCGGGLACVLCVRASVWKVPLQRGASCAGLLAGLPFLHPRLADLACLHLCCLLNPCTCRPLLAQVLPKREGLLHVSEWGFGHVRNVADVVKEGDLVDVMITELQVRRVCVGARV